MTEQLVGTLLGGVIGLAIGLLLIVLFAIVFRWLWNTTMPEVFGLKHLTYWQSIKVLLLAGILFGGHRVIHTEAPVDGDAAQTSEVVTPPVGTQ
jgi:hypothetical protein